MTRFSLGIPTAVVLLGLSVNAMAQTPPQSPVATETAAPTQTPAAEAPASQAPAADRPAVESPAAPVETAPAETAPAAVAPTAPPAAVGEAPVVAPSAAPVAAPGEAAAPSAAPTAPATLPTADAPAAADAPVTADAPTTLPVAPENAAPSVAEAADPALPSAHDLSPMGMYQQADLVVKAVMILLGIACFLSWTVLFYKMVETAVAKARARKAARILTRSTSLSAALAELKGRSDPAAFMVQAVADEYRRSDAAIAPAGAEGIKERAASLVHRVEVQASSRLRRGMGLLATIGSVGPFVGLFGTVWGIMNSFIGIAETQTTNLAVVAPGIAEALFATALGLVAAIPAVVIYNHFTRVIQGYKQTLGDAGAATLRLLSRDIDFRHLEG